jgi:predicted TIM-barrel fold metal-dependent hydrolase
MATTDTASTASGARERKVPAFVFDCVCHIFNFDKANALGPPGDLFDEHLYAFHQLLTRAGEPILSRDEFFREWSVDEIYDMVIEGSDTDMIVAQPLPLTDLFHDGLSPWEKCAEMAAKHPDRAVFWGSVNPLEGKKALDLMTRQVEDHGAKAFKFYNVRYDYGQPFPWRMDDPRIAFPVFEHAQKLGVNLVGVHKGVPLGPQPIEHTRTFDMDGAAANFPDINFVIFHVGLPWLDEVLWQIVRYPNLYASIAATVNFISRQPRVFAETLGKMMWWCGEDKIIYGGESPIWHPQWALEAFWNFELPRDIVEERGYPQLTEQAKRKILGENLARLHGIDVEAKKAELGVPG